MKNFGNKLIYCCLLILMVSLSENVFSQKTKMYTNPVLDTVFPDPAILQTSDGWYYAYGTNMFINKKTYNIQVMKSRDLVHWQYLGDALPVKPTWASTTQEFWAPQVLYDATKKKYYMYFSANPDTKKGLCLAVAIADKPWGPFTDKGSPLLCGDGFENIDPMAFDDPKTGKHLLYWGSGFKPIKIQELSDDRISFKKGTQPKDIIFPNQDKDYGKLLEGSWVMFKNNKYYIFYSGDNCCGENAHYAVMVARADDPFGPYEHLGQSNGTGNSTILEKKDFWVGPGHNAIATDKAGNDWIIYHAIHPQILFQDTTFVPSEYKDRRIMLIDRIYWKDGWPRIEGDKPSFTPQPAPITD